LTIASPFNGNYTNAAFCLAVPPTTAFNAPSTLLQVNGTVNCTTTNNWITGTGTSFLTDFSPGAIIDLAGDNQVVVQVINSTALIVGTPWSSNANGANVFSLGAGGLSYFNANNNLYTGFTQFQFKICLLTDDSSKVPIIDNLRALAVS
jgi:hypothetical protein